MTNFDSSVQNNNEPNRLGPVDALPEFNFLIGEDVAATPGAFTEDDPTVEGKRTKMSTDCFEEACSGDMSKFALLEGGQRECLKDEMLTLAADPDVFEAIRYGLVVHDLFKSKRALEAAGLPEGFDHDEAYKLVMTNPDYSAARDYLMPSLQRLTPRSRDLLLRTARISSNYPQTLQGEAPPATLEDLHTEPDPLVRDIDIVIKQFDIFGALGHINQEVSLTATPGTYRAMQNLNSALRDPKLISTQERNDAFLTAEVAYFAGSRTPRDQAELTAFRAVGRLVRHLRIDNVHDFEQLTEDLNAQPGVIDEIIVTELGRRAKRATLANHSPDLVRTVAKLHGGKFALQYLAHVLQEVHIADKEAREAGLTGIASVQLDEIMRAMHRGEFGPRQNTIRFVPHNGMLVAKPYQPSIEKLDGMPAFRGEMLRGKRIMLVGEGGGSDGVQAAMLGKLLSRKYDCDVAAVVSIRSEDHHLVHTGRRIGQVTKEVIPQTEAVGDWRFLERIPLEGDELSPMYVLSSTDPAVVRSDVEALLEVTGAAVVIGVDTGGDSLYRTLHPSFSAHLPTDITPDHDYNAIQGLAAASRSNHHISWLSAVVAPGVDSPDYARTVLDEVGAAKLALDGDDALRIQQQYAVWRMDGSGSEEGRYGKTPLAWLHALRGNFGVQLLNLPRANVLSETNPWRAFTVITPAMADIVVMDMGRHFTAIRRP